MVNWFSILELDFRHKQSPDDDWEAVPYYKANYGRISHLRVKSVFGLLTEDDVLQLCNL